MLIPMRDFIASGTLGPVCLGMNREQFEAALGPPHAWSASRRRDKVAIWKYGGVELHWSGEPLWMIYCDDFNSPRTDIDLWILRRGLSPEQAEAELLAAGIEFTRGEVRGLPDDAHLISAGGVRLHFVCGASGALELTSCFIRAE